MGGDPEVAGSYSHSGGGRTHMGGAPRWQGRTHIVGVGGHTHMGGDPEVAGSYSHSGGRGPYSHGRGLEVAESYSHGRGPEVAGSYSHSGGGLLTWEGPRGGRVVLT